MGESSCGAHNPGYCRVFRSTDRNRVKVAKRDQWRVDCNLSVLRQRLGFGHCCSDSQKSHRKPTARESCQRTKA